MRRIVALSVVVLTLLMPAGAAASPGDAGVHRDLAAARAATARYHRVAASVADGFIPLGGCVSVPGLGGQGVHHGNPARFDTTVSVTQPEVLMYEHTASGIRLVGIEYFAVYVGQPAPQLFGQTFMGPMPGHDAGMPTHYDLHVWLWQTNPSGMFADFNPNVSC